MSTARAPQAPDPNCHFLALTGSLLAATCAALLFHGWTVTGNPSDLVPCVLSALLIPATVVIAGRVADKWTAAMVFVGSLGSIALGKMLTGQTLPNALVLDPINLLLYGLTPLIATALIVAAGPSLLRSLRSPIGPARPTVSDINPIGAMRVPVLIWLVVVSAIYLVNNGTDRTGFRMITLPFDAPSGDMSLLGFSVLVDTHPVMAETLPAVEQVSWFAGGVRSDNNFRFLRAGYAFLASQLTPIFDQTTSLLIVNFVSWLGSLALVWHLTLRWTAHQVAASAAVCLASVGIGFGVHINDATPHLTSFALYYLGIVLIDRFEFGETPRPWRTHLVWGLIVGLISLEYNVAQMLLFVYGVVSLKCQRWIHLVAAAVVSLSLRPLWQIILPGLGINVREVEGEYLVRSLDFWQDSFQQGIGTFATDIGYFTIETLTALESPWLLILALVGLVFLANRRQRILCVATVLAPVLACVFFAPTSNSRGYIVYGASLVVFVASGNLFGRFMIRRGSIGKVAALALLAVCSIQLIWTTAHHRFWTGPAKMFLLGAPKASPLLWTRPEIESLTGQEPLPIALGGTAAFVDGGAVRTPATEPVPMRSFPLMVLSRVFFVGAILVTVWLILDDRRRRRITTAVAASAFLFCGVMSFARIERQPAVFDLQALPIAPRETIQYSVRPRADLLDQFAAQSNAATIPQIEFFLGASAPVQLRWLVDGKAIPVRRFENSRWVTDGPIDLKTLRETDSWTFQITNPGDQPIRVRGWQRNSLPERRLDSTLASPVLPGIEIRIRDAESGALRFAAF
ncbi:hypothetical protein FYK55_12830 [Roseiconus nitratireducens]|uniref:Uncharacterized protein n=1 Tax=Roseiconus nitratireducens TaxID=2605748 RepID=A0A5M6D6M6_9BACT|nr:hypothetical protein [Roseiconus nitratireducens]KAA5543161.1 hypothetical protein FYK55_12830 [Roseiconus nitratireducens]